MMPLVDLGKNGLAGQRTSCLLVGHWKRMLEVMLAVMLAVMLEVILAVMLAVFGGGTWIGRR